MTELLQRVLPTVQKPARYTGGEYNEIKKKSYLKNKDYTLKIYKKLNLNVIIMDDKDLNSIAGFLKPKLKIN